MVMSLASYFSLRWMLAAYPRFSLENVMSPWTACVLAQIWHGQMSLRKCAQWLTLYFSLPVYRVSAVAAVVGQQRWAQAKLKESMPSRF